MSSSIKIKNKDIEGDCKIISVICLEKVQIRFIVAGVLGTLTLGIFLLFFRFSCRFKKKFLYSETTIEKATHFFV